MNILSVYWSVFSICIIIGVVVSNGYAQKRIDEKYSYPPMYVGEDCHLNEPYWIKHPTIDVVIRNPLYTNKYGGLKRDSK